MASSRALSGLIFAAVVLAACSSSTPGGSGGGSGVRTQTSGGGQVTAVVGWAGPAAGAVFDVKLDTHSVNLDGLDLANAVLRNDRGETLVARPWGAPPGGHHRSGALTFSGDVAAFLADARWVELVLAGVGDLSERSLRWELGS